jgi:hypothetical protein
VRVCNAAGRADCAFNSTVLRSWEPCSAFGGGRSSRRPCVFSAGMCARPGYVQGPGLTLPVRTAAPPPAPPALLLWCSTSPPICPADWSGYDSANMSMYGAPQGPGSYGDGRVSFNQLPGPSSLVSRIQAVQQQRNCQAASRVTARVVLLTSLFPSLPAGTSGPRSSA